jgi:serine phosphatase RsbU (regulator of sigma subunit)
VHVPEDVLDTAEFSLSVRRLAQVLPEPAGQYSELEKISCLLDFQYYFGKSFSPEKTFVYILRSALQISGAERGFILRKAPDDFAYALGLDASGRQLSEGEFGASRSVVDRVRNSGDPVFMTQGLESGFARQASIAAMKLRAVACLPLEAMTRETPAPEIVGILYLDSRKAMHSLSGLDRKVLTSLAGEAGRVLEKLEMVETLAEKRRVEQELTIAEETQRTLLPHSLPEFGELTIRAFSRPTRYLGGDFYDFIPADQELAVVLADVSGKGIPAALLSSLALGALNMEYGSLADPAAVFTNVNKLLCRKSPRNRFVTLLLAQFERRGRGCFISAGHNTAYIFRADSERLETVDSTGTPLGMFPFATYEASALELRPGDTLAIYSDGLTDAENPAGEEFGEDRLRELLLATAPAGAAAIESALLAALDEFTRGAAQTDDITLVLVQRQRV